MKLHFFTVPARFSEEAQHAVNAFCAQHRVLALEKQFVALGHDSYWAICIRYVEHVSPATAGGLAAKRDRVDYKTVLDEQDFAVYAQLRALRKTLSEQDGVPAYALFTNEQLAEMVTRRVRSGSELAAIDGVGKARLEKYGDVFLRLLNAALNTPAGEPHAPPAD